MVVGLFGAGMAGLAWIRPQGLIFGVGILLTLLSPGILELSWRVRLRCPIINDYLGRFEGRLDEEIPASRRIQHQERLIWDAMAAPTPLVSMGLRRRGKQPMMNNVSKAHSRLQWEKMRDRRRRVAAWRLAVSERQHLV